MRFKPPKNSSRFYWTNHVFDKMLFYGLSEQRIKRVLNRPDRIETGIAPKTLACMQITGSQKRRQEIWVMYQKLNPKIKIISTWRYPGKSPAKNPIPQEILEEVRGLL